MKDWTGDEPTQLWFVLFIIDLLFSTKL